MSFRVNYVLALHHFSHNYLEGHAALGSTVDSDIKEDLGEIFSSHIEYREIE